MARVCASYPQDRRVYGWSREDLVPLGGLSGWLCGGWLWRWARRRDLRRFESELERADREFEAHMASVFGAQVEVELFGRLR